MVENEVKNEAKEGKKESSFRDRLSSFMDSAASTAKNVFETVKDQAGQVYEDGKNAVEEKIRERDANEIYRKLGKKVYTLVSRDELELPESCEKYIEALDDMFADDDKTGDEPVVECEGDECKDGVCKDGVCKNGVCVDGVCVDGVCVDDEDKKDA